MKPIFKLAIFALLFNCALSVSAQGKNSQNATKGFWVVENNVHTPKNSIVYFYNEEKELIYKESVNGKRININRKKVCRQLNMVLEQSLLAWEKEKVFKEDQQWLATKL
jgi:hypothetical protein